MEFSGRDFEEGGMENVWAALAVWWLPLLVAPVTGSFLGVLITRLPAGEPVALSRSRCGWCGHPLGLRDLIPLLSWLASQRRCRHCGSPVSWFYPNIEIASMAVAAWAATEVSGWLLWATCGLGWMLLALAVIDARHMLLPDVLTLPLAGAGLGIAAVLQSGIPIDHGIGLAVGFVSLFLLARAYRAVRGREGLGLGDAKLLAAAGAWVSWQGLPSVVLIAGLSGLLFVLVQAGVSGRPSGSHRLPFGPHLCLGTWLVWLYGPLVIG
jgi:leader peptidase (prepilin peptidase)/N-methyltransferase